jgi:hypothetical protein
VTRALTLAIALVVLLTACAPTAESFSIHRFSASGQNEFPPFDRTVTDAAAASRLYQEIRALRPPEGTVFCALDFGVRHELSFFVRASASSME